MKNWDNWYMDPDNANRLHSLVQKRIRQEIDCPGVYHFALEGRGREFCMFSIIEEVDGNLLAMEVKSYVGQDNSIIKLLAGPDTPAIWVEVSKEVVRCYGSSDDQYYEVLATAESRLTNGFISIMPEIPYGYVQDGIVIAIWFRRQRKVNVEGAIHRQFIEFAMEGHDLPAVLLLRDRDPVSYNQRCWELMRSGHIVDLHRRIISHPGSLWFVKSNVTWPHLFFDRSDDQHPLLPPDTPYLLRLASDAAGSDLLHTRALVANYLQADVSPEDLSSFFAR
jgi:hypothetical protein